MLERTILRGIKINNYKTNLNTVFHFKTFRFFPLFFLNKNTTPGPDPPLSKNDSFFDVLPKYASGMFKYENPNFTVEAIQEFTKI